MAARIGRGLEGRFLNISTIELGKKVKKKKKDPPLGFASFESRLSSSSNKYEKFTQPIVRKEPRTKCYRVAKWVAVGLGLFIFVGTIIALWIAYQADPAPAKISEVTLPQNQQMENETLHFPTTTSKLNKDSTFLHSNETPKGTR